MEILRNGTRPSLRGSAEQFTGSVRMDPLLQTQPPARAQGLQVTFEPGARSNWHAHPLGQTLVVLSGVGRVQTWGGSVEEIRPGDVVWVPAGEKHWHGAADSTSLVHIAIQEALDGKSIEWLEPVTDEQYRAGSRRTP